MNTRLDSPYVQSALEYKKQDKYYVLIPNLGLCVAVTELIVDKQFVTGLII